MSGLLPISTYNLALKPFNPAPAVEEDFPVTIRLTLAAVDPEAVDDKEEPSTLRLLKRSRMFDDEFDEDDFDEDDEDDEDEDDEDEEDELDEEPKGKKGKKLEEEEDEDEDDEDDDEDDDDEDDDEEDDEDVSEFVVCTLSPKVQYQQTIDLTITPDEEVYFVVTGSYPIHLTGNYVEHPADDESDDEFDDEYDSDEYDLTPDEDEMLEDEEYDLDDLENASDVENKIEELVAEDNKKRTSEDDEEAPKKKSKKNKEKSVKFNKELEQGPTGSTMTEEKPKKDAKKDAKKDTKKDAKQDSKETKAKDTKEDKSDKKYPTKTLLGGVVTEDRKVGKGPTAKTGAKVGIRYIGKLKNGKVFDKNTSGKPFAFGLGKGECIKGFDLGVAGMAVGGERRVVIPAKMGYGSQALPGIPANSELTFDIKLVSLK